MRVFALATVFCFFLRKLLPCSLNVTASLCCNSLTRNQFIMLTLDGSVSSSSSCSHGDMKNVLLKNGQFLFSKVYKWTCRATQSRSR